MAPIVGKKISGKTYYYLVESARVDGKPRIVSQQYLGPADEVAVRLAGSGPGDPDPGANTLNRYRTLTRLPAYLDRGRSVRDCPIPASASGSR
jgi:hypothetical protein